MFWSKGSVYKLQIDLKFDLVLPVVPVVRQIVAVTGRGKYSTKGRVREWSIMVKEFVEKNC